MNLQAEVLIIAFVFFVIFGSYGQSRVVYFYVVLRMIQRMQDRLYYVKFKQFFDITFS